MFVKLTEANGTTNGGTVWGPGVKHCAQKKKSPLTAADLCSPFVIHYYADRYLAVLLNPAQANFKKPQGWEFIPEGQTCTDGLKCGAEGGMTIRRTPLPRFSTLQKVAFGIFCGQSAFGGKSKAWDKWAGDWLSGKDRSEAAARAAAEAAWAAAWAARAAARAAVEAAWAAGAAGAAWAAGAAGAAGAAWAARAAACAAAWAARAAGADLNALAIKAYRWKP